MVMKKGVIDRLSFVLPEEFRMKAENNCPSFQQAAVTPMRKESGKDKLTSNPPSQSQRHCISLSINRQHFWHPKSAV